MVTTKKYERFELERQIFTRKKKELKSEFDKININSVKITKTKIKIKNKVRWRTDTDVQWN